jgi:hypothetical protein
VSRTATLTATAALTLGILAAPANATFPGQNGLIAYTPEGTIHTVNPDGSQDRLLTQGTDPEWTPDGSMLLFNAGGTLYSIRADGTARTALPTQGGRPQASPDSSGVATGDGEGIATTRGPIATSGFATLGDWGANGLIAWTVQDGGLEAQSPEGATLRLPVKEGYRQRDAQWAPDARSVYFAQELDPANVCFQDPTCPAPSEGIMRMSLDGRQTTVRRGTLYYPAPSPDGTRLAYGPEYGLIAVDGKVIARGTDPDWQPLPKLPPPAGPDTSSAKTTTVQVPVPGPERVVYQQVSAVPASCVIPKPHRFLVLGLRIKRAIGLGATSRVRVDLQSGKATVLRPEDAGLRIISRSVR